MFPVNYRTKWLSWTFHESHFVLQFTGKMPDPDSGDGALCEPAQSKCMSHFMRGIYRKNVAPRSQAQHFVRACGIETHMDTQNVLREIWVRHFSSKFPHKSGSCGLGDRHFSCKFPHKLALVTCPGVFGLHMCALICLLSSVCSDVSALL